MRLMFCYTLSLALLFTSLAPPVSAEGEFPLYVVIEDNVHFWESVYETYSSTQGILHDNKKLNRIYAIIDLVPRETPGSGKINRELVKLARLRYKGILTRLGAGEPPTTREEKKVAALFKEEDTQEYLRAREGIRLQVGQRDRFHDGVIRSGKYLADIKKIFTSMQLPVELAYLPHVESSFNPSAKSKAGAVGIWQFTRGTGQKYLRIDDIVDERYDPLLATQAAAKLLKTNYERLKTWPFALTAYNYGRSGMVRAVREHTTYTNIFNNHRRGHFKFAARNFYAEFLAAIKVAKRMEKDPSTVLARPEKTITWQLPGFASLKNLSLHFGISSKDLAHFNPALLAPVLTGKKLVPRGYQLRLPATAEVLQYIETIDKKLFSDTQLSGRYHRVRRGETAGNIAKKHKVRLADLKRVNNLDRQSTIRIGQKLLIPEKKSGILTLRKQAKKTIPPQ
ncbi:MAG: lytic transglycosylase [Desulfobulbus propionicus]|nr:MAG: lytic transglycosylase [Desulfobulbus propionicus]